MEHSSALILFFISSLIIQCSSSQINPINVFNVMSFGAAGDGVKDDTEALKMAWERSCQTHNGAILQVPRGHSFLLKPVSFTGPCESAIHFQLDGTIMPPDGPDSWPSDSDKKQWLVFQGINGLAMKGTGVINGRGENWWKLPCKPRRGRNTNFSDTCESPVALRFFMSSNLTVDGILIKNSPQFNFRFDYCQDVYVKNIAIFAPRESPNTDGIHVENTTHVSIHDSLISTGDDCVSIGSGSSDVDIRNITCGPSHGISIGSLGSRNTRACVSGITVTDSVIRNSDNGVRIKTWQGGQGSVAKVAFKNIRMENVSHPIIIDQYYCLRQDCKNQSDAVYISDVKYNKIWGTYDVAQPPVKLACSDSIPCTSIDLSDIELVPSEGRIGNNPFCWNAYGSMRSRTVPPVFCLRYGNPKRTDESIRKPCFLR